MHLVGHDWGAAVAWALAATRPDLVSTADRRLGAAPWRDGALDAVRRPAAAVLVHGLLPAALAAGAAPLLAPVGLERALRRGGLPADALARVWPEIIEDGALTGALNWYRAMPFSDPRVRARAGAGADDTRVERRRRGPRPRGRRAAPRAYVDAPYRLEILAGISHWIPNEAPERLAEIVLARVRS